jgi:hypothetical protein
MDSIVNRQFDPSFPFGEEVFLSDKPMTDNEFNLYVRSDNNEIPIEEVDFTDPRGM